MTICQKGVLPPWSFLGTPTGIRRPELRLEVVRGASGLGFTNGGDRTRPFPSCRQCRFLPVTPSVLHPTEASLELLLNIAPKVNKAPKTNKILRCFRPSFPKPTIADSWSLGRQSFPLPKRSGIGRRYSFAFRRRTSAPASIHLSRTLGCRLPSTLSLIRHRTNLGGVGMDCGSEAPSWLQTGSSKSLGVTVAEVIFLRPPIKKWVKKG
ncbi:hypothetical protein VNO77_22563 [Canavalia gladiata]|uniref:Uncharacterized protein n=1 Tax=Canavalia gladiata TaxID=3824 RepID=A0AAN9L3S2_CANGL